LIISNNNNNIEEIPNISMFLFSTENYEKSLKLYKSVIKKNPNISNKLKLLYYFNISLICNHLQQFIKSNKYIKKSFKIKLNENELKDLDNKRILISNFFYMGLNYLNLCKYEKSIKSFEESLKLNNNTLKEIEENIKNGLSDVYLELKEYNKSIKYQEECLTISQSLNNYENQINNFKKLGIIYSHLGNFEKSIKFYEDGLLIKKKLIEKKVENFQEKLFRFLNKNEFKNSNNEYLSLDTNKLIIKEQFPNNDDFNLNENFENKIIIIIDFKDEKNYENLFSEKLFSTFNGKEIYPKLLKIIFLKGSFYGCYVFKIPDVEEINVDNKINIIDITQKNVEENNEKIEEKVKVKNNENKNEKKKKKKK